MRSDVPVGAYLSGGVDSSLVVAGMTKVTSGISTYSIGFNSPIDETKDAEATARFLGTKHHTIHVQPADFNLLPKIVWHMDRPVGDALIIAFHQLANGAAKDLKVVLGGEGADECFAGYDFLKKLLTANRLGPAAPLAGNILKAIPHQVLNQFFHFPADLGSQGKKRGVDFLLNYRRRHLMANFYALRTLWSEEERRTLYAPSMKDFAGESWIPHERPVPPGSPRSLEQAPMLDRLLRLQFDEWLQDWALIRQDKNTMAHSLEYRLPFLDHRLIELAFRMPPHLKLRGRTDKWIERRLADKAFAGMSTPARILLRTPGIQKPRRRHAQRFPDQSPRLLRPSRRPRSPHPHGIPRVPLPQAGHVPRHPRTLAPRLHRRQRPRRLTSPSPHFTR